MNMIIKLEEVYYGKINDNRTNEKRMGGSKR